MFDGNLVLVAAAGGGATFFDFSFYFPALVENYRPFSSNCPAPLKRDLHVPREYPKPWKLLEGAFHAPFWRVKRALQGIFSEQ
jgi:hypothetical protein